jgi:uncharacterized membrane protein YhaH (DUF805 family)
MHWFIKVVKQYADFNGRARRSEYWFYILFYMLIIIALALLEALLMPGVLTGLFTLGLLLPSLAVAVRRLHDTDRSGWWVLIAFLPLIGGLVLLVFMVLDGTEGENRFGPSPKAA